VIFELARKHPVYEYQYALAKKKYPKDAEWFIGYQARIVFTSKTLSLIFEKNQRN